MDWCKTLLDNLGKLKRNEENMTPEQKVKYAAPLKKLKHDIWEEARELLQDFLVSGLRIADDDSDWREVIRRIERVIGEAKRDGSYRLAASALFASYDVDKMLEVALPIRYKVLYEAYGPYWLRHCKPISGSEYTFSNDIIGMEWWEKNRIWASVKMEGGKKVTDYRKGLTVMLPPTMELLDAAYKRDMEAVA